MTLQERLDQAQQQSVSVYLRRQQIEAQRHQIAKMALDCDQALIRLDGQIALLTDILTPEQPATHTPLPFPISQVGADRG